MAEKEKETKLAIKKLLNRLWPDCWQIMVVPTGYGVKGIPDHLACVPVVITPEMVGSTYGMFLGIEAKSPTGEEKATQVRQLAKIVTAQGFSTTVWGLKDMAQLETELKERFWIL